MRGSAHALINAAFIAQLGAVTSSETGGATFLRRFGRQFRWLLLQLGPLSPRGQGKRRLEATNDSRRCQGRRFGDSVGTVLIFVICLLIAHVFIFAIAAASVHVSKKFDVRAVYATLDASLMWPRTVWPFFSFALVALVLRASRTMALSDCWIARSGVAWGALIIVLAASATMTCALFKVVRHVAEKAQYDERKDSTTLYSAVVRGAPLFESQATGIWTEATAARFVATQGAVFDTYVPTRARVGEVVLVAPQFLTAFILGICRRVEQPQVLLVLFIAIGYLGIIAVHPPYANKLKNVLEITSAGANVLALIFLSAAAFHNESGLYAVAAAIELCSLIIVVFLPAIIALISFVRRRSTADEVDAIVAGGAGTDVRGVQPADSHIEDGLITNAGTGVDASLSFFAALYDARNSPVNELSIAFVSFLGLELIHLAAWAVYPFDAAHDLVVKIGSTVTAPQDKPARCTEEEEKAEANITDTQPTRAEATEEDATKREADGERASEADCETAETERAKEQDSSAVENQKEAE